MTSARTEVIDFLRRRSGLIVHFASAPLLIGTRHPYPRSLLHVLSGADPELSASIIQPGDRFGLAAIPRNATGMVGLVLSPRSDISVIAIGASDAGSRIRADNSRHFLPSTVDVATMERSMEARGEGDEGPVGAYNEWGMRDYEVLGVFVADPANNEVVLEGSEEVLYAAVGDTMRALDVPPARMFTLCFHGIAELIDGTWAQVDHGQLYA